MTKMRLFVASLALPALLAMVTPAFAQEAESTAMSPEQDEMMALMELADLPLPSSPIVAVIEENNDGAEIAEGPGGHPGGPGGEHGWHHHGPLEGALAITDDQLERLAAISDNYHENVGPKMLALHNSMHHLMEALGASSIDSNKVSGLQDKIVSLKGDIARMQSDKLVAVANVFTPDQRHAVHIAMLRHRVGEMMMGGHGRGKMHHHGGGHPAGHHEGGPEGH